LWRQVLVSPLKGRDVYEAALRSGGFDSAYKDLLSEDASEVDGTLFPDLRRGLGAHNFFCQRRLILVKISGSARGDELKGMVVDNATQKDDQVRPEHLYELQEQVEQRSIMIWSQQIGYYYHASVMADGDIGVASLAVRTAMR